MYADGAVTYFIYSKTFNKVLKFAMTHIQDSRLELNCASTAKNNLHDVFETGH